MQTMPRDEFLNWAAGHGIGADPEFEDARYLTFRQGKRESRFWEYPTEGDTPHFVSALVAAIGADGRYWIYPANGHWQIDRVFASYPQGRVWRVLLEGLGLPMPAIGAVGVGAEERDLLLAMLFLQVTLGPAMHVDATVIPEDGSAVLFFEHHGVVHLKFREPSRLDSATTALANGGYALPTQSPDTTFKPVQWMKPEGGMSKRGSRTGGSSR